MGVLNGLTIAVAGTLDYDNTQIKKWVEANGGRYSPSVSKHITHLIASKAAWKDASDQVQQAVKHQAWVLTYDWLEDSLLKKRKLAETKYSWEAKEQERRRNKEVKKLGLLADTKKFQDGCEAANKATGTGTSQPRSRTARKQPRQSRSVLTGDMANVPFVSAAETLRQKREAREKKAASQAAKKASQSPTNTPSPSAALASSHSLTPSSPQPSPQAKKSLKDLYQYYLDATGFEYKILLARCDLPANTMQRYQLSILESHAKPNVYCTFIQYHPAGVGEPRKESSGCIQAVFDFNSTFQEETSVDVDEEPAAASSSSEASPTQHHPEATRLLTLATPPVPSPSSPYKTLLAPMASPFPTAFRAFRHAFRDLTLLAWEERFALPRPLYRLRAARHGIEPFVYVRPKLGLPTGLAAQEGGLFCGRVRDGAGEGGVGVEVEEKQDEAYVRPAFPFLPALAVPLGQGVIGAAVRAERREKERKEDVERERDERKRAGQGQGKRKRNQGPLFDWWRTGDEGEGDGDGGAGKRRRMFPAERRGLE